MALATKITIKIDAEWGSPFQKESAIQTLFMMLNGWREFRLQANKNNKIGMNFHQEDQEPPRGQNAGKRL